MSLLNPFGGGDFMNRMKKQLTWGLIFFAAVFAAYGTSVVFADGNPETSGIHKNEGTSKISQLHKGALGVDAL